jgi:hypothetical protein
LEWQDQELFYLNKTYFVVLIKLKVREKTHILIYFVFRRFSGYGLVLDMHASLSSRLPGLVEEMTGK